MKPTFCLLLLAVLISAGCTVVSSSSSFPLQYKDPDTGFTLSLPASWRGYSVVQQKPKRIPEVKAVIIRHPRWSANEPYQDVLVFAPTLAQWAEGRGISLATGGFDEELYRNSKYVFAVNNRDFDNWGYAPGDPEFVQNTGEVDGILVNIHRQHPESMRDR